MSRSVMYSSRRYGFVGRHEIGRRITLAFGGIRLRALPLFAFALMALAGHVDGSKHRSSVPGKDRHVVVIVWDGMRPDFVTERNTPTLWKLSREGVTFRQHHSVYPTATDINGAAIATGVYPNRNGLL